MRRKKYNTEEERKEAKLSYNTAWRAANKNRQSEFAKRKRQEIKNKYAAIKTERGCLFCNEYNAKCLDWHHKSTENKIESVSVLIRQKMSEEVILQEIAKCVVLCSNCHRKLHNSNYENVVFKGWGYELWIVNNNKYCGKILGVKKEKKCSYHYHILKDEVFYIQSGKILLKYGNCDDICKVEEIYLNPGDSFHIEIGLRHQFFAIEDSIIVEFSTHHEDSDSIRVIPGD